MFREIAPALRPDSESGTSPARCIEFAWLSLRFGQLIDPVQNFGDGLVEILGNFMPEFDLNQMVSQRDVSYQRPAVFFCKRFDALRHVIATLGNNRGSVHRALVVSDGNR